MLEQGAVESDRGHGTLDHFVLDLATRDLIEHASLLQLILHAIGFADSRGAHNDHGADVARDSSLGHVIQDGKSLFDAIHDFLVGLFGLLELYYLVLLGH